MYSYIDMRNQLRSNAVLNFENNDKFCFIWSILASLQPCNNNHPNRFSNYRQYFDELNVGGFDFTMDSNVVMFINLKN